VGSAIAVPDIILCADWSKDPALRTTWIADVPARVVRQLRRSESDATPDGIRRPTAWTLETLEARAREIAPDGRAIVAVDAPLGVPDSFLRASKLALGLADELNFAEWLPEALKQPGFLPPVHTPDEWSVLSPFFRVPSGVGGYRQFVAAAAIVGVDLKREIEKRTRGNSVFAFDLPGQVGPAAQALWQELVAGNSGEKPIPVWPFDGSMEGLLATTRGPVLAEMYPRAAYGTALAAALPAPRRDIPRSRRAARDAALDQLTACLWVSDLGVTLADLELASADSSGGEFDALLTAAALLRLTLEELPLHSSPPDVLSEGGMLCSWRDEPAPRARHARPMTISSPVLESLSPEMRRLEVAAARVPELDLDGYSELEPLIDAARQALADLATELERRR
jgi:hypothetical protein